MKILLLIEFFIFFNLGAIYLYFMDNYCATGVRRMRRIANDTSVKRQHTRRQKNRSSPLSLSLLFRCAATRCTRNFRCPGATRTERKGWRTSPFFLPKLEEKKTGPGHVHVSALWPGCCFAHEFRLGSFPFARCLYRDCNEPSSKKGRRREAF